MCFCACFSVCERERERERCIKLCERCYVQRCDFRADLNVLREELFCSSDGRLFQRKIERGKKTREGEGFFNKRDRVQFFSKGMSRVV